MTYPSIRNNVREREPKRYRRVQVENPICVSRWWAKTRLISHVVRLEYLWDYKVKTNAFNPTYKNIPTREFIQESEKPKDTKWVFDYAYMG